LPIYVSLYLDVVRFLAALGVFLHHLSFDPFSTGIIPGWLSQHGPTCVIIFFVLSGYVIAFVSKTRETTASSYIVSRVSRLYSVSLVALALTFLLDTIGTRLNPELYTMHNVLWKPESLTGYLSSLFFVNEYQVLDPTHVAPGTNTPFWSISFEATYYLLAGFFLFLRRSLAVPLSIILLFAAGRTIAVLWPLWMLGFVLFHVSGRIRLRRSLQLILFLASAAVLFAIPKLIPHLYPDNFGISFPWGPQPFNQKILTDYVIGLAFAANIVSVHGLLKPYASVLQRKAPAIRWLGSLTFPLYLLHYPAICFFRAISPAREDSLLNVFFIFFGVTVLVIALAPVTEKLRTFIRGRLTVIALNADKHPR
jgi:peptidoglycan/LPS O-acetylase OafA/YrhL